MNSGTVSSMETKFGRKEFRQVWLCSINELTDYKLQVESWLDKTNLNPHWSFVEFLCCYFDDVLADVDYIDYQEMGWISAEEFEIISDWHIRLDQYNSPNGNDYDHSAILSDPRWVRLVADGEAAKRTLAMLLEADENRTLITAVDHLKINSGNVA